MPEDNIFATLIGAYAPIIKAGLAANIAGGIAAASPGLTPYDIAFRSLAIAEEIQKQSGMVDAFDSLHALGTEASGQPAEEKKRTPIALL